MMLLAIVYVLLGLVLILVGANYVTDGASALAKKWGMSDLMVGLTVVAFGTSAPEFVVSVMSAISGNGGMAVGNVVGSNIVNLLLILGATALVTPIKVEKTVLSREMPMVLISAIVLLIMGNGVLLDGNETAQITRVDGLILILMFIIFLWYNIAISKNVDTENDPAAQLVKNKKPVSVLKAVLWSVGGLAALIIGGDKFVDGAKTIASYIGVSDAIIGLTVAAIGTSLPELATSVAAALKGKTDMAIGNVIGSNIFNAFMVLGAAASVHPAALQGIGNFDLLTMVGASVLVWIMGWLWGNRIIKRGEGAMLLLCYVGYIVVLIASV